MNQDKVQFLIANSNLDMLIAYAKARIPEDARAGYYLVPFQGKTLLVAVHAADQLADTLKGHQLAKDFSVPNDEETLEPKEWEQRFRAYEHFRNQLGNLLLHELHPPQVSTTFDSTSSSQQISIDRRFALSGAPLVESWSYGPFEPAEANIWVYHSTGSQPRTGYKAYLWPERSHGDHRSKQYDGKISSTRELTGNAPEWLESKVLELMAELMQRHQSLTAQVTTESVEAAAEAMWDDAKPVRAKVRPPWVEVIDDSQYARPVRVTRHEARLALVAATKQRH